MQRFLARKHYAINGKPFLGAKVSSDTQPLMSKLLPFCASKDSLIVNYSYHRVTNAS